jgi:hypothetical protein
MAWIHTDTHHHHIDHIFTYDTRNAFHQLTPIRVIYRFILSHPVLSIHIENTHTHPTINIQSSQTQVHQYHHFVTCIDVIWYVAYNCSNSRLRYLTLS